MNLAEKQQKKIVKHAPSTIKNPEATPIWFNEEFKKEEISDEDKKELEELMKGYQ